MSERMRTNYEAELAFAKNLASKAGEVALQYYKTDLDFTTKSDSSPVTIADETINQMVIDAVKQQYPDDGVLGEEQSWQLDKPRLWVTDPIDATVSFAMGEPEFMFSMALVIDGKPLVAVTTDLANGDLFWATFGGGSYMNEKLLQVSPRPLSAAWLALPTNLKALIEAQDMYTELTARCYQTNMIHGSVFKGMLIAQGLCDGAMWFKTVHPWDAAAVKLIVEEAGGKLTSIDNQEHRFDAELTGGMVISNGVIHNDILQIIAHT